MLKWLPPYRRNSPSRIITDDPLATISAHSKVNEVYSVSRVNPLYVDDECWDEACEDKGQKIPFEKISRSSGYESHRSLSGDDEVKKSLEEIFSNKFRAPLSTIPEGKIDATVPRPVWPKRDSTRLSDDSLHHTSLRFDPSSRIHRKAQRPSCASITKEIPLKSQNCTINTKLYTFDANIDTFSKGQGSKGTKENKEIQAGTTSSASSSGFSELTTPSPVSSSAQSIAQISLSEPYNTYNRPSFINANIVFGSLQSNSPKLSQKTPDVKTDNFFQIDGMLKKECFGRHGADFTLDQDQAEKLIKRLKIRKQQRCICRFVISFLSLIVFILCVVIVSLLITNGKRIFGSL